MDNDEHGMLARIDERTQATDKAVQRLEKKFNDYVLIARFSPVERIVYAIAGVALIGIITALVNLVLLK